MRNSLLALLLVVFGFSLLTSCGDASDPSTVEDEPSAAGDVADPDESDDEAEEPIVGKDPEPSGPLEPIDDKGFERAEPVNDTRQQYSMLVTPRKGDVFSYVTTETNVTTVGDVSMNQKVHYEFTGQITNVNSDRSFTMQMWFTRIRNRNYIPPMVVDSQAVTVEFDSDNRNDKQVPGAREIRALINQKVTFTISADGEIREISNVEPIVSKLMKSVPDTVSEEIRSAYRERIRQSLKIAYFMPVVRQLFVSQVPKGSVAVGESWTRTDTLPIANGTPSVVKYRLAEVRRTASGPVGRIVIAMDTKIGAQKVDDELVKGEVKDAAIEGSASTLVDLNTGFPLRKETSIVQRLTITGTPKTGPMAGKSQTVRRGTKTTTVVELKKHTSAGE